MQPRWKAFCAVLVLGLCGAGCAEVTKQAQSLSRLNKVSKLAVGMPKEEVLTLFGKPYKSERWGTTEFLIYETNYVALSSSGRFTPVGLIKDKVVGWGSDYYEQITKSRKNWDTLLEVR